MKKRILCIGDSAYLNTGYGIVCREICNSLSKSDLFDVRQIGLHDHAADKNRNDINFRVYPLRYNPMASDIDRFGKATFNDILKEFCPHIVLTIGDPWHLSYISTCKIRYKFKWISYIPIDGEPLPRVMIYNNQWLRLADITDSTDVNIAFTKYGKEVLEKAGVRVDHIINHGVDTNTYYKIETSTKEELKKEFFADKIKNIEQSKIFGFIGRNQFRKNLPSLLKAWKIFKKKYKEDSDNCYLYFHTPSDDAIRGFNLPEIIELMDLDKDSVIIANNLGQGRGFNNAQFNKLYNSLDCSISGTMGEGWGLPLIESQAAGIPTIVTNYSGHLEFCNGVSWLINVKDYITEIASCIERAIIDEEHLAALMSKFVRLSKEEITQWEKLSINNANKYIWADINKQWIDVCKETEVIDYSFNKEDFFLREQDTIIRQDEAIKIIGNPIDYNISPKNCPHIGFITTYNEKCGIATYSSNLKNAIEKICDEKVVTIFSELKDYNELFRQIVTSKINILHWQHEPGIIHYDHRLMNFIISLNKERPDIKNIFTLHSEHPMIVNVIDGICDKIIMHANKSDYHTKYAQLSVLPHPLPEYTISNSIRNEYRKKLGVEDKFVIGFNGFMSPSKSLDSILKQMAPIVSERFNLVLYFLNSIPESEMARVNAQTILGSMRDICREYGIEKNVIIDTNFYSKEEMSNRIQVFDIGLSFMGGETLSQSGSIAEMVANGVVVACSNVTHFSHMIKTQMAIPINDMGNSQIFAINAMNLILSRDRDIILNSIKTNVINMLKNVGYNNFAKEHIKIYKELVGN